MQYSSPLVVETRSPVTAAIIWLHGLGSNGFDFEPIVAQLRLPSSVGIRFVFPHAPQMPVTVNGGYVMPAWYDILDMKIDRKVDVKQLIASANFIQTLIDKEIESGISSKRIILAGFSQGGAVGYHAALTYPQPLGGLIAMSTYFATSNHIELNKANLSLPITILHGTEDSVVDQSLGRLAADELLAMGLSPDYQTYTMAHTVCMEEVNAISSWIKHILSSSA